MIPDDFGWFRMIPDGSRPGVTIRTRHGVAMDRPDPTWNGYGPIRIRPGGAMGRPWIGFGPGWIGFGTDWIGFGPPSDTQVAPMLLQCGSKLTKGDFQLPK